MIILCINAFCKLEASGLDVSRAYVETAVGGSLRYRRSARSAGWMDITLGIFYGDDVPVRPVMGIQWI